MSSESHPKDLVIYRTADGREPFSEWLDGIPDAKVRNKLRMRLHRVEQGNLGDHESVGEGVIELRDHYGPGYRIYCAQEGEKVIVLICGGDKSSQKADIKKAHELWEDYGRRGDA